MIKQWKAHMQLGKNVDATPVRETGKYRNIKVI